jgi:hypothetical protein
LKLLQVSALTRLLTLYWYHPFPDLIKALKGLGTGMALEGLVTSKAAMYAVESYHDKQSSYQTTTITTPL